MAAGVRDLDGPRMTRAALAAHGLRSDWPVRSCQLRTGAPGPRCAARLRAYPRQPRIHFRWRLCSWLAHVRHTHAAVPVWTPAIAGGSLWCAGVSAHLGADRADDL